MRATETGYEKSTVLGGNKAFAKHDSRSRRGAIKVDHIKAAVGQLDLATLAMRCEVTLRYRPAAQRIAPARCWRNSGSA